ncbi:MAG TPA: hypothetical protein VK789_02685 [Bryobacteraceae bacterium]|nr:hypothetical protein [Bryobacteraceae bacterium]
MSWSSGKDSTWTLHLLRKERQVEVATLITTFNQAANRVAMHAVRRELAEAQAARMGLPMWAIELPWPCPNSVYEELMSGICRRAVEEGLTAIAFGDLFLEDIRAYREQQMAGTGLKPLFPVWKLPTRDLAWEMIRAGVKAKVTCVDPARLDRDFAGREFDAEFLNRLPENVDPCGENGEFHTFVYDAPVFSSPIKVGAGEIVERDGFVFSDLLPL